MAITYGFYDSLNGDRKHNAKQMSEIFNGIINDGVFMSIDDKLMVTAKTGMTVSVGLGRAWFDGTWTRNDSILNLTLDISEIVLNRIDAVVLETNSDVNTRANTIKIVKGTPATTPINPVMIKTGVVKQYPLAYIYVGKGVTSINQGNITNAVGTSATPFVTGILQTMNIDALILQWKTQWDAWRGQQATDWDAWTFLQETDWATWTGQKATEWAAWMTLQDTTFVNWIADRLVDYNNWSQERKDEWDIWFANVQETLDENVASQLLTMIGNLNLLTTNDKSSLVNAVNEVDIILDQHMTNPALNPHNINSKVAKGGDTLTGLLVTAPTTGLMESANGLGTIEVRSEATKPAAITFHRSGAFATHFGLDIDNQFKYGGWSAGANKYAFWTEQNMNIATKAQAEAGTDNAKIMTPLRVNEVIVNKFATKAQAEAGTDATKIMTPLRVKEAMNTQNRNRIVSSGSMPMYFIRNAGEGFNTPLTALDHSLNYMNSTVLKFLGPSVIIRYSGTYNIKFGGSKGSFATYYQIYVNGNARGTLRTPPTTLTYYTESLSLVSGDVVEMYGRIDHTANSTLPINGFQLLLSEDLGLYDGSVYFAKTNSLR